MTFLMEKGPSCPLGTASFYSIQTTGMLLDISF